jgi:hypothetical protein
MSLRTRRAGLVCLLAVTAVSAGCGSGAGQASSSATPAPSLSLATSLSTGSGTWAVAVMGGSAASHNNFWQLFVRPGVAGTWHLATPPGVASNGGLVVAGLGAGPVVAGFRPSQNLASSPLATTRDDGAAWSPAILDAGLADVPDALAAAPDSGRLLALLTNGKAEISGPHGTGWTILASQHALAGTEALTRCKPGSLTAAAFSPSGVPMLAASCTRPGAAGIFADAGGTWHPAGPTLAASYDHQNVTVLRLTTTAGETMALLAAGSGQAAHLLAARSADGGAHWVVSPALPLNGARPLSVSFGTGGTAAVTLTGNRADTLAALAGPWRRLPPLPSGTATLAQGSAAGWEALAVHGTKLTVWQLAPGARAWAARQTINVPIQFGSSG